MSSFFNDKQGSTRLASFIVIILFTIAVLVIYVVDNIDGRTVPELVNNLLFLILGFAAQSLGFSHGVSTANGIAKDTATAVVQEMQK